MSLTLVSVNNLCAQELEPRAYSVIPQGTNVLLVGYSLSNGSILTDATSPLTDFEVVAHTIAAGYLRTFNLFGKLARINITTPFVYFTGDVKLNGKDTSGTRIGLADTRIRLGINILGSPALHPKDFQKFKEESVLGTSIIVSVPTGQYDKSKLVNLGSNRWGFKPEIGFSYAYNRFYFELFGGVWLFTPNYEFLGAKELKQEPIYNLQTHIIYSFPSRLWVGLDGNYFYGGRSSIDGAKQNDKMNNSRLGCVVGFPVNVNHAFRFQFHTKLETSAGSSYTVFTLAYQYLWF